MVKLRHMKHRVLIYRIMMAAAAAMIISAEVWAQETAPPFHLESAVMCEQIRNFKPEHPAVVFPISQGEVFCYSNFNPVREKSFIYHQWYKKDRLISTIRLTLSPPKWASFSSIKTRNSDKGPWRVEIRDASDRLIETLRFSVTD